MYLINQSQLQLITWEKGKVFHRRLARESPFIFMAHNVQLQVKIIMLGDTGVGKTSLINRLTKNTFDGISPMTLGAETHRKNSSFTITKQVRSSRYDRQFGI